MKTNETALEVVPKSKSLPELIAEASMIFQKICEAGGEITPEVDQLLQVNETELAVKVDAYYFLMDRMESDAEYLKEKAATILKTARACAAASDRLRDRIKDAMKNLDKQILPGEVMRFQLSKSLPKLEIDESKLPEELKMQVTEWVPDKERIKFALQAGDQIPGAKLIENFALRSYVNKRAD